MKITGNLARAVLLTAVCALIPLTAYSAQQITPGKFCKVLNQKVKFQNKTYTCIKSGKKLIWNKGVVFQQTPTNTPAETFISEQSDWGIPDPAIPFDSFINVEKIASEAFEKDLPPTSDNVEIKMWFEDGIGSAIQDAYKEQFEYVAKRYSGYFSKSKRIDVIGYSTKAWGIKTLLGIDKKADKIQGLDLQTAFSDNPQCNPNVYLPTGWTLGVLRNPVVVIPALNCKIFSDRDPPIVPAHELTHAVQIAAAKTLSTSDGTIGGPLWLVEGQAELGANFLNYYGGLVHPSKIYCGSASTLKFKKYNPDWIHSLEFHDSENQNQEYGVGLLAANYLVARSGWKKSLQVEVLATSISQKQKNYSFRDMSAFSAAFKTVYGQNLSDFYTEVQIYLKWLYENGNEKLAPYCNGKW